MKYVSRERIVRMDTALNPVLTVIAKQIANHTITKDFTREQKRSLLWLYWNVRHGKVKGD